VSSNLEYSRSDEEYEHEHDEEEEEEEKEEQQEEVLSTLPKKAVTQIKNEEYFENDLDMSSAGVNVE